MQTHITILQITDLLRCIRL